MMSGIPPKASCPIKKCFQQMLCYTYTLAKHCHNSWSLHMEQEFTTHRLVHCSCTCTDKWYVSHHLRKIMPTRAIITLIFTSLGIIFVEPLGKIYCEIVYMFVTALHYTISVLLPHCIIVPHIYIDMRHGSKSALFALFPSKQLYVY